MADYPFKINITTKDGTQKSFFDADFATDADTLVSASVMVTRVNAMKSASSFIESIEAPSLTSTNYNNASEGIKFLSASVTHPNTGSVIFQDTETTDNGGLDHYEFYGTKVCSVLGLPEGVPIYTENFKLSDSSTDTTNYISGEFISDNVALKRGFKMSPQARMRSNLIWDEVFGEGFVQWVSGSSVRMSLGYDNLTDRYELNAPTASVNVLEAFTNVKTNKVSLSSQTLLEIGPPDSGATHTIFIGDGDLVQNGEDVVNPDGTRRIAMGADQEIKLGIHPIATPGDDANTTTNLMTMDATRTKLEFSDTGGVTIRNDQNTVWSNTLNSTDYQLLIQCESQTSASFAGVAFQIEDSSGLSDLDAINGAIAVVRDNSTDNLTDGNMIFATNDDADGDLTERMRITHDGKVGIGTDNPQSSLDVNGDLTIAGSLIHGGDTNTKIVFGTDDIGFDAGGVNILDIDSNDAVFNEGGGNVDVRMEVDSGASIGGMADLDQAFVLDASMGVLGIGDSPENTYRGRVAQFLANADNAYVAYFRNDGNNANRSGIVLQIGTDNQTGTNTFVNFQDGDGDGFGTITGTSGTISYNPFTGAHSAYMMESDSSSADVATNLPSSSLELYYERGTIVSSVSSSYDSSFQPLNFVVSSSTYQDKRAYGVYLGSYEWNEDIGFNIELKDQHLIASVGDGYILVNNQNGDIEIGDYITTASGSGGYGCKQSDDLLHNYTVAKATDSVTWSDESTTYKLLACTYHCG